MAVCLKMQAVIIYIGIKAVKYSCILLIFRSQFSSFVSLFGNV